MRRPALVLISALAVGASAGFFAHDGTARESGPAVAASSFSVNTSLPGMFPVYRPKAEPRPPLRVRPPKMSIPRLHLKSPIFAPSQLRRGPAWWPITGRPGGGDTVAVAGHRTTHTRPFYYLERLRRGDRIFIAYGGRTYPYRVSTSRVLSAENLHIADAVGYERLLLTACTPRGSARSRLVVEALPE